MSIFQPGDKVRNVNPNSRYHDLVGTYMALLPWSFVGPVCDLLYPGHTGPYGYPYVAQAVQDLKAAEDESSECG